MPQIYLPGLKSLAAERKQASLYSGDYLWLAHLLKAESWQWKWKWMWKWEWECRVASRPPRGLGKCKCKCNTSKGAPVIAR